MQQVIALEIAAGGERIDERERRPRAVHHRHRHRAIERDDGRRLQTFEQIVQPDDLTPVGLIGSRRLTMQRRNRGLHRERTDSPAQRLLDQR